MSAATKNLPADRGATFSLGVRWVAHDGTPMDLDGWTVSLRLVTVKTGTPIALYEDGNGDSDGWAVVDVTDEQTATWPVGRCAYRLEVESPAGEKHWLVMGELKVRSGADV